MTNERISMEKLGDALTKGRLARDAIATWADIKEEADATAIDIMDAEGMATHSWTGEDGVAAKVALVKASTMVFDEAKLKKAVGAEAWKKITTPKLDKDLLEAAIKMGVVDANTVAACTEERPKKPYLKFTEKKGAR